jgi:two-component system cell cycle response regulator DivK
MGQKSHLGVKGVSRMATGPARILYIEDNSDNRLLVKRVLEAEGYKLLEAANAQDGLRQVMAQKPDLILMDINLPEVDGYTTTARIKAMPGLAAIKVIAVTANVMKGDREKTLAAGCDGYITKPIDVDTLPGQIARFLES